MSSTLRTWSGAARALPTMDSLASVTFIISVPVEMSEKSERTRTPPGRHAGAATSRTVSSPDLVVLRDLLHRASLVHRWFEGKWADAHTATPLDRAWRYHISMREQLPDLLGRCPRRPLRSSSIRLLQRLGAGISPDHSSPRRARRR